MMNKRLAQFALPVLMLAFTSAAQAAPQETVTFGQWGSPFFKGSVWEVVYVDTGVSPYNVGGYKSVAGETGSKWLATNYYEASPATFESTQGLFSLDSLWIAGAWGSQTLTITGYFEGVATSSTTINITTTAAEFNFSGFQNIDSFAISANASTYVQDNLLLPNKGLNWALGSVTVTPVPEPEAYAMLLAGLAFVGAVARRRRGV